ncbi:hypothetical protein GLOIN_2v1658885 [Rhizophagus clarus]|uniref:Crinkler effector protein N-terminal domain-containing protein n=1 Tax=Rhizophagus clarus TaxID=94130 RepID=A0A8H3LIL9_9GLOM|nr:hypothetical protein GLOIN_2v1658885 [Rhizophagus clarus]
MSITLLCLVKGNTTASAFPVDINKDQLVGHLKEAIKAKKHKTFHDVEADEKLWKKEIPDDQDDLLSNLTLNDGDELLATREIGDYWAEKPPKRHIHVLVSPPEATSNREQELLDQVTSLQALLNKSTHDFDVVVHPKRKPNKWTANIEHATLEGLKEYIRKMYQPPALENDGAELNLMNDGDKYSPRNDQDLREILRIFVSNKKLKFTVFIETPSKPFSDWSFPKVCQLYGISNDPNPDIDVFPPFSCGSADLNSDKSKAVIKHLMAEIKLRQDVTPLNKANEATKSIYSYCYLASGVSLYKDNFKLIPEKLIEGRNGQVKKEDFMKGFAQASVQMESTLSRKRKADEIDNGQDVDRVFGIVTDASEWYFMECSLDNEGKPAVKLSESVTVVYKNENLQVKVEKVLGHIVWILEEAQKPVEASQSGVKRRITELEAENVEIAELRKENAELRKENTDFRMKFANFESERAELKRRIAETLRMTEEERTRRVAENAKLKARIEDSEIKQRNKEKRFLRESAKNQVQDVTSDDIETINNSKLLRNKKTVTNGSDQDLELSLGTGDDISASTVIEGVDTKVFQDNLSCDTKTITCTDSEDAPSDETSEPIATQPLDRNQVTEQILKRDLSRPISSVASVELHDKSILNNAIEGSTQRLAYWIDEAIRVGLKEIVCLYHYSFEFEEKVKNITADGKTKDKTARSMIYKDMLQYLPNVTLGNLRIRTHRAKNILMLFGEKGVGIDRIKLVTCSASDISRLTNTQIQNIIDYVNDKTVTNNDQSHVTSKTVTIGNDRSHDLSPATPRASVSPVSIPRTNPTYDRSYFHNKILDQYSNLYREYSSEDFDYYDITDKTLCDPSRTCPLCKLDHDDEESIEGRYKTGSYFIKCKQCEIEITA